ncbi:MAG: SMP-30/gluconolactonase/LRE family protein [Opitutales bacterium]|nr:SMP-30/gluconolactonase/LRE family protein [Opitutales bacterium]
MDRRHRLYLCDLHHQDVFIVAETGERLGSLRADGSALYLVESHLPGVSRIPILPDGSAGPKEAFLDLPGDEPDGLAFDAAGHLWISISNPTRIYRLLLPNHPSRPRHLPRMTYQHFHYSVPDGIATITFNRPDQLNAMNRRLMEELIHAITRLDADPEARVGLRTLFSASVTTN